MNVSEWMKSLYLDLMIVVQKSQIKKKNHIFLMKKGFQKSGLLPTNVNLWTFNNL